MTLFILLMGVPGSGKSTMAANLVKENNALLISTDQLRRELTGSETNFSQERQVFATALDRVKTFLKNGANVVYDATNLTRATRRRVMEVVPNGVYKICYFRKVPLSLAIYRNLTRKRVVPVAVITRMFKQLKEPSAGEGWDEVRISD